ncbi:MAG: DUF664 domain-containing protein [Candidatus Thorarchaeota archaeon]|nr:MAG: DUF664 domain-containing protein [Candidatus Thorarchaeota archaeon]
MLYDFLHNAVERHLIETRPLLLQLDDDLIHSKPTPEVREMGEVALHLLRSLEYYLRGLSQEIWESAPYTLEKYGTIESLSDLVEEVFERAMSYMKQLSTSDLSVTINSFNRPATVGEILLEMLEHSIHHRGQLTVYFRLLGIKPETIAYII